MIVRVRGKGQIRYHRAEVKHRSELDAKLARRVYGDAELECLAHARGLDALPDPAPEGCVEQNHVAGQVEHISREVLKVDDDRVCCQRHAHLLAHAAHSRQSKYRVLQIIVPDVFDLLAEPNARLSGPDAVRIEAEAIAVECSRQSAITFQLVLRPEDTAFQLVRREAVTFFQFARLRHKLFNGSYFTRAVLRVRVTEEEV